MWNIQNDIEYAIDRYNEMVRDAERRARLGVAGVRRPAAGKRLFQKGIDWLGARWADVQRALRHAKGAPRKQPIG